MLIFIPTLSYILPLLFCGGEAGMAEWGREELRPTLSPPPPPPPPPLLFFFYLLLFLLLLY